MATNGLVKHLRCHRLFDLSVELRFARKTFLPFLAVAGLNAEPTPAHGAAGQAKPPLP